MNIKPGSYLSYPDEFECYSNLGYKNSKGSLLNYVPHVLSCLTCLVHSVLSCSPRLVSQVLLFLTCLFLTCSRALRAACLVLHVPHALVLSCLTCLVPCVLPRASCLTCLVPYVPSCFMSTFSLVPLVPRTLSILCANISFCVDRH